MVCAVLRLEHAASVGSVADAELLMNTPLHHAPVRHVVVVTLLSLACAFCSGCHSSVMAGAAAPAGTGKVGSTTSTNGSGGQAAAWPSQAPAAPLDERPITPMETVGAADV
jgi:hypothetical protein